ncbi:MAG: hypothetical protein U5K76_11310 [Woeseiaceae bacterium]|nr:hypothetical protein [Woeseiaceae bacterium]
MQAGLIEPGDMSAWDAYVEAHEQSTAYHLSGWRDVIARVFGRETYYIAARSGDDAGNCSACCRWSA